MSKRAYIVSEGQTLYDLALQLYGDVSAIIRIIEDNPAIVSIETDPIPGSEIIVSGEALMNADIVDYYAGLNYKVNTGEYIPQIIGDSDWLLTNGAWNDTGFWRDEEFWIDNV